MLPSDKVQARERKEMKRSREGRQSLGWGLGEGYILGEDLNEQSDYKSSPVSRPRRTTLGFFKRRQIQFTSSSGTCPGSAYCVLEIFVLFQLWSQRIYCMHNAVLLHSAAVPDVGGNDYP